MPLDERKIIARRAAMELPVNGVVNLGIGMPEGVAAVANEEQHPRLLTLTAEPGVIGGMPASGLDFGAAVNTEAMIDQNQQFDFYDGGGLDLAVLGMAEADAEGNVNVSRFGSKLAGAGGFINISQNAERWSSPAPSRPAAGGRGRGRPARIMHEGGPASSSTAVEQVTFSGGCAAGADSRSSMSPSGASSAARREGLELIEIAPGIDLERDILAHMASAPGRAASRS